MHENKFESEVHKELPHMSRKIEHNSCFKEESQYLSLQNSCKWHYIMFVLIFNRVNKQNHNYVTL